VRFRPSATLEKLSLQTTKEMTVPLAIAGTGYGVIGILVIILLVVLIFYFLRRA
jgi:predicted cation transporter